MSENINKKQTNFNENDTHNNLSEKSLMSEKEILKINEKYTVILDQDVNFKFYATRNGESWRDLTGDKLVLAMFQELQTAKEENEKFRKANDKRMSFYNNLALIRVVSLDV